MRMLSFAAAFLIVGSALPASQAQAPAPHPEPGWIGVVIARGELRDQIESTPMVDRPYRPLHFYGNTVRRSYYRGAPVPRPRDVAQGAGAFVTGR